VLEEFKIQNFHVPTPLEVVFHTLANEMANSAALADVFKRNFNPNYNQRKLKALLETSTVPKNQHLHVLLYGGVGSGKTWAALSHILDQMCSHANVNTLAIRRTAGDVALSVMPEVTGFLSRFGILHKKREKPVPQVVLPNESTFFMRSDKSLVQTGKAKSDALGSTKYSFVLLEEADSISEILAETIPGRMRDTAGVDRKIIFYICNPPGRNSWIYRKWFLDNDPHDPGSHYRALHMPIEGNAEHLDPGYVESVDRDYSNSPSSYARLRSGEFGPDTPGDPIYQAQFNRSVHVSKTSLEWNPRYPIIRMWDFGWNGMPCIIAQNDLDRRQVRVLGVKFAQKTLFEPFLKEVVDYTWEKYPGANYLDYTDAAGRQKTGNGPSYHDIMRQKGLEPQYLIHTIGYGVEVVNSLLSEMSSRSGREIRDSGPKPSLLIDPECHLLIEMFETGYCNKPGTPRGVVDPVKDGFYDHIADAIRYGIVLIRRSGTNSSQTPGLLSGGSVSIDGVRRVQQQQIPRGRFSRRRR
jgi:hypothetical protein